MSPDLETFLNSVGNIHEVQPWDVSQWCMHDHVVKISRSIVSISFFSHVFNWRCPWVNSQWLVVKKSLPMWAGECAKSTFSSVRNTKVTHTFSKDCHFTLHWRMSALGWRYNRGRCGACHRVLCELCATGVVNGRGWVCLEFSSPHRCSTASSREYNVCDCLKGLFLCWASLYNVPFRIVCHSCFRAFEASQCPLWSDAHGEAGIMQLYPYVLEMRHVLVSHCAACEARLCHATHCWQCHTFSNIIYHWYFCTFSVCGVLVRLHHCRWQQYSDCWEQWTCRQVRSLCRGVLLELRMSMSVGAWYCVQLWVRVTWFGGCSTHLGVLCVRRRLLTWAALLKDAMCSWCALCYAPFSMIWYPPNNRPMIDHRWKYHRSHHGAELSRFRFLFWRHTVAAHVHGFVFRYVVLSVKLLVDCVDNWAPHA